FMEKITSKSNDLIKYIKKLAASRKARMQERRFVLEGARLSFDVLNSVYQPDIFLITEKAAEKYKKQFGDMIKIAASAYFISEEVADKLAETENTQGVFCVCNIPDGKNQLVINKKYVALDHLQDPSNLGAIIRTAEALGINGAICYNCCDIYNPKALRASMGSILRLPVILSDNLVSDIEIAKENGFSFYAAVPDKSADDITKIDFPDSSVIIIGNEGNGISEPVKAAADKLVTINMLGRAESLNASMAGAIAMWEMLR
ncbi:MAG: RNA methyltransferase, partial [Eubacterium sp.]|nr:RNA methyltransferase [Eubacterium sp.]